MSHDNNTSQTGSTSEKASAGKIPLGKINMEKMPLKWCHIRIVYIASLGQLIGQGLATLVGIVIPLMQLTIHPELSSGMQGLMGCISLIGIMLGTVVFGRLSDRYGYLLFPALSVDNHSGLPHNCVDSYSHGSSRLPVFNGFRCRWRI